LSVTNHEYERFPIMYYDKLTTGPGTQDCNRSLIRMQ